MTRHHRLSRRLLILLSVVSLLSGTFFVASTALAVNNTGAFQLDGNASTADLPTGFTGTDDADRVCYQDAINEGLSSADATTRCTATQGTSGGKNGASAVAVQWIDSTTNLEIFTGGGSKDPENPGTSWAWKPKDTIPDKDTIQHSFAARYSLDKNAATCPGQVTDLTCEVIYFGVDRFDNSGDAQLGFWFFKGKIGLGNTARTGGFAFTGDHQNGDLLLISQFSNGGSTATIEAHFWDTSCKKAANNDPQPGQCSAANLKLQAKSTSANCASSLPTAAFCGITNVPVSPATTTPAMWTYNDKTGNSKSYLIGEYYEAGVNLSSLGIGNECFPSFLAESRSSTSPTATLKDFVLGSFQNCSAVGQTTPSSSDASGANGTVTPGTPVTDTMTVTGSGTAQPPFPTSSTTPPGRGNNVVFKICGPIATGTCNGADAAHTGTQVGNTKPLANTATQGKSSATSDAVNTTASPLGVGRYCFAGSWAGDDNYPDGASDTSSRECFTVTDTSSMTSAQNWLPNDSGTVTATGGTAMSGTMSFTLYDSANCTGTILYQEDTDPNTAGVQPPSFTNAASPVTRSTNNTSVKVSTSKTVSWKVVFTSSNPNVSGSDHCESTQLTITN